MLYREHRAEAGRFAAGTRVHDPGCVIGVRDRSCSDRPFPGIPRRGLLRRPGIARSASTLHAWRGAQAGDARHGLQRVARLRYCPSHCEPVTHRQTGGKRYGERVASVRSPPAVAGGADLDPGGARCDGVCRAAGDDARPRAAAGRAARRVDQGPARRGDVRRDLRPVLRAGEGRWRRRRARSWARPRGPVRRGRAGGLHAVRGAERHPAAGARARQAGRHPRLLRPRRPCAAVQPAPGGQQDRPGRDDRRDRALQGQPGHPGRGQPGADRDRPAAQRGHAGRDLPAAGHEGGRRPVGRPAGGAAGLAQRRGRRSRRKAPRTTRPRCVGA